LTTLPHLRINHAVLVYAKNLAARPISTAISCTIQIIQKDHENSPGPNPIVHSPTKKTGISSAETYVSTRFTACGCSSDLSAFGILLRDWDGGSAAPPGGANRLRLRRHILASSRNCSIYLDLKVHY